MGSVPLAAAAGAYVRFNTQPLPVLTVAHAKRAGPLQPAGSKPKVSEASKPVIGRPSLDAKVMLSARFAPTAVTRTAVEGVATTRSSVPAGAAEPANPEPAVPPPVVWTGLPAG